MGLNETSYINLSIYFFSRHVFHFVAVLATAGRGKAKFPLCRINETPRHEDTRMQRNIVITQPVLASEVDEGDWSA